MSVMLLDKTEHKTTPKVFARHEVKYLINYATWSTLSEHLGATLAADNRGPTLIRNLYLDTPTKQLIRRSIAKPCYKEKLRVRTYGLVETSEHKCFMEIKKKLDGRVYKRRSTMTLSQARDLVATGSLVDKSGRDALDLQILREIEWSLGLYQPLGPAISVNYSRCAYEYPKVGGDVRITVDCNVAYKEGSWQDFFLSVAEPRSAGELSPATDPYSDAEPSRTSESSRTSEPSSAAEPSRTPARTPSNFMPLLSSKTCVMEIKALGGMPLELTRALNELEIYPTSFSKVGNAFAAINMKGTTK